MEERGREAHRVGGGAAAAADDGVLPGESELREGAAEFVDGDQILVGFPVPGPDQPERDAGIGYPVVGPGGDDDDPAGARLLDDAGQQLPYSRADVDGVRAVAEIDGDPVEFAGDRRGRQGH